MTMVDKKCDVCGVNPPIGVACTFIPYSCAYCEECARRDAQPELVFETWWDCFENHFDEMHEGIPDKVVTVKDGRYMTYREWADWRKGNGL